MALPPFMSLLAKNAAVKRQSIVRDNTPFGASTRRAFAKQKIIKDQSGFSFFDSPDGEYTGRNARKQGFKTNFNTTANGTRIAHSIQGPSGRATRINPNAYLRTAAEIRTVTNPVAPFSGGTGTTRQGVFVNDREITPKKFQNRRGSSSNPFSGNPTKFDAESFTKRHNAEVDENNTQLQPAIDDFNAERFKFAKNKNRALNGFGSKDPAKLNKNARQESTNISGIARKKLNSSSRLKAKGNSRGVGLGTGGAGLGI